MAAQRYNHSPMKQQTTPMGTFKNSEFAQMPHTGTPIRYRQKRPVRNRQQGAEKILPRAYGLYVSKKFFCATQQLG
jgi:hypothetical protein